MYGPQRRRFGLFSHCKLGSFGALWFVLSICISDLFRVSGFVLRISRGRQGPGELGSFVISRHNILHPFDPNPQSAIPNRQSQTCDVGCDEHRIGTPDSAFGYGLLISTRLAFVLQISYPIPAGRQGKNAVFLRGRGWVKEWASKRVDG